MLKITTQRALETEKILWAKSEEDRQRFISLQARLDANLYNPVYVYERVKKWLNTTMEIHQENLFEQRLYKVRENAGQMPFFADYKSILPIIKARSIPLLSADI